MVFPQLYKQEPHLCNKRLTYSPDAGQSCFRISVPEGSYDIDDINKRIQQKMTQNGHAEKVNISANSNTLKTVLTLENDVYVDFRDSNSIASSLLGFDNEAYIADYQESVYPVNILSVSSILVNVSIISGSYVNGQRKPTIYSFFPAVPPGYKIIEKPANLVYLPITLNTLYDMETTITDQADNLLNFRGENITIRFHAREI